MIIGWDDTPRQVLNYAIANYQDEAYALLIHQFHSASLEEAKQIDNELHATLVEIPDELLSVVMPTISMQTVKATSASKLLSTKFKTFETHTDVWSHYMEDDVDSSFIMNKDLWTEGLISALSACMEKNQVKLIVLAPSRGFDPTPFYIMNILYMFDINSVELVTVGERDNNKIDVKNIPVNYQADFLLTDPEVLMLLLVHKARSPRPENLSFVNVNSLADMFLRQRLTKYLPPRRSTGRHFFGYYKYLKKLSDKMVAAKLLNSTRDGNTEKYAISEIGRCYLSIVVNLKTRLPEHALQIVEDMDKIIGLVKSHKSKST